MEENKVVYRFDVDFSGAASTAPVINIASTDLNSRMFVMTPKNGSETLVLSDTVNPVLILTKTQNGKTEIVATITCLYVNGKIVADVPIIDSAYTSLEGTVIFYEYNNTAKMFKLQSAPFKVSVVSSAESSGTVTAADEFKAFVDALTKADSLCKVVYASSYLVDNMNVNLKSADCLDKIIWVIPPNGLSTETGNPLKINFTDGKTKNIVRLRDDNSYTPNIPRKYINLNRPMALWVEMTYAMWVNCPVESSGGGGALVYNDDITKDNSSASENDIRINTSDFSSLGGKIIDVNINSNKAHSPYITGRMYLLRSNQSVHSSAALPIAVKDPDTGGLVPGDSTHYNPYFVPMNYRGTMRLLINDAYALWLNPPFYYCIDADRYLGKNLEPYDDPDWKCKIFRGKGFVTIQGVCKTKSAILPTTAGERDIIAGVPFRPISHSRAKYCTAYDKGGKTSTYYILDGWLCTVDHSDGSIWVSEGSTLSAGNIFCINATYAVYTSNEDEE